MLGVPPRPTRRPAASAGILVANARAASGPSTATAGRPSPSGPGSAPATLRRESALIDGEIRPFRGDYRSAIVTINALATRLQALPEVAEVRIVKLPLNVNPSASLAGNTLDNPEQTANATAEFRLMVLLKPDA